MEPKKYPKDDIVINLQDMLLHIALRWRSIVAGVLVLTILAGGFKYYKDYMYYQSHLQEGEQDTVAAEQLSEQELANVQLVLGIERAYRAQVAYNANSPLMLIDPNNVPSATFSGVITGENSRAAAALYEQMLASDTLCQELATTLKWKQASYVREMINISLLPDEADDEDSRSTVVKVVVFSPDKEQARTIAEALVARWPSLKAAVTQAAGAHSAAVSAINCETTVDPYFRDTQQNHIYNLNNLRSNLKTEKDKLSNAEKVRLEKLSVESQDDSDEQPEAVPPSISKKYLVLGFGGGLVLFVGLYMLTYLFGRSIKSEADMFLRFDLPLLGTLSGTGKNKKRCCIDCWFIRLLRKESRGVSPEAQRELFLRQAILAAQKQNVQTLCITGSALTPALLEMLNELGAAFKQEGVTLLTGPCPLQSADTLQAMACADALLLAETTGKSSYTAVERELTLATQLQIPVLGAVVLE